VPRVEGAHLPRRGDTPARTPADAPRARATDGNGRKLEPGWTGRRTLRSSAGGRGGRAQLAGCTSHRHCRRRPGPKRASTLRPRRA
jgi:hypothetical protein